jgi:hypothetical protein
LKTGQRPQAVTFRDLLVAFSACHRWDSRGSW